MKLYLLGGAAIVAASVMSLVKAATLNAMFGGGW